MNTFKRFAIPVLLAFLALGLISVPASAAGSYPITVGRTFTATGAAGAQGGNITGCTTATPIVCTTTSAHNLVAGDEVRVLGIVTETEANGLWYVTVPSTTTIGLYSDAGLSVASVGTHTYASGGTVTASYDVSALTGDFTIQLRLDSLTATKNVLVSVQESEDGFVSDIRTLWTNSWVGGGSPAPGVMLSLRKYQLPDNRFGASGTYGDAIRLYVQAIDGSATAIFSLFLQY